MSTNEQELGRQLNAAEKTVAILKSKVKELYNGGSTSVIHKLLEKAQKREEAARQKRQLMEVRTEQLESEVKKRTRAIRTIIDNVKFGFLVIGHDMHVQDECTHSCLGLFDTKKVAGKNLCDLLQLNEQEMTFFQLCIDQIYEDLLPATVSMAQLPRRFETKARILSVEGSIIRDEANKVNQLLFTVSDITALEAAQRESNNNRVLVRILKEKESFKSFLLDSSTQLVQAKSAVKKKDVSFVRRVIHTVKGNSASYGLTEIMSTIHGIEEHDKVVVKDLELIEDMFRKFLKANYTVLEIDYDRSADFGFEVTTDQLKNLKGIIKKIKTKDSAEIKRWTAKLVQKPASTMLGPVGEFVAKLADRLRKDVEFEISGTDTLMDVDTMRPVFQSMTHMIRNAIDHGIEPAGERKNKSNRGYLKIALSASPSAYRIVIADDGRGIDVEMLKQKAVEKKLLTKKEAQNMADSDAMELIFLDGLSTAKETTDISGRGVGMSAIKAVIDRNYGEIKIETKVGKGTTFTLSIPKPEVLAPSTPKKAKKAA